MCIWVEKPKSENVTCGCYDGELYDAEDMDVWLEKLKTHYASIEKQAKKFDNYLESIKDSIPHVSLADYEVLEDKLEAIKSVIEEDKEEHPVDEAGDGIQYMIKKLEKILEA